MRENVRMPSRLSSSLTLDCTRALSLASKFSLAADVADIVHSRLSLLSLMLLLL